MSELIHGAEISVRVAKPLQRAGEPLTCGVPLPKALIREPGELVLLRGSGEELPVQAKITDCWSDGSARWILLDWLADIDGEETFRLARQPAVKLPEQHLFGEETARRIYKSLRLTNLAGTVFTPAIYAISVEANGPIRWCWSIRGPLHAEDGTPSGNCILFVHLWPALPVVRVSLTIHNPTAAEHPGGLWDLGNGGSLLLKDASLTFPLSEGEFEQIRYSESVASGWNECEKELEIYQDSSGGENWNSSNHINRNRVVPHQFRGCRVRSDSREDFLNRATPIVELRRSGASLAVAMPLFWQNFPKALEVRPDQVTLRLFPEQSAQGHEIQGGEQKTHVFWIAFGKDPISNEPLKWTRDPAIPIVSPEWVCSTQAVLYLTPKAADPSPDYLALVDAAVEGEDTFERKREVIDEYGWRHFGDVWGDHEAVFHEGPTPLISHYNNQYDNVAGFCWQYLRSGDVRWLHAMTELARHVIDIDIYNTDQDKSAYNHGLFWHTYHYVDADTGTHRSYPKNGRIPPHGTPVPGGGPANEQNYATGLMHCWLLTGDPLAREAAKGLARWVIDMDDGSKTIFRVLSSGDTGLASSSRTPWYHGPGRGAANSISALLDGHRLTGEVKFLNKAEELIRRVIHPNDDIAARNLLDAENRWFYTMCLQSLGKYLDHKAELQQFDLWYAYARESLLNYARWMAIHEYPYLQKPEKLEYPTETWAAQDMRKCDIFLYAAMHSDGEERSKFLDRARFFFCDSVTTLSGMKTRSLCRPVVLLLSFGWMHAWFHHHPDTQRPRPSVQNPDFGKPLKFTPQKVIAMSRVKKLLVVGAVLGLGLLVVAVVLLLR